MTLCCLAAIGKNTESPGFTGMLGNGAGFCQLRESLQWLENGLLPVQMRVVGTTRCSSASTAGRKNAGLLECLQARLLAHARRIFLRLLNAMRKHSLSLSKRRGTLCSSALEMPCDVQR